MYTCVVFLGADPPTTCVTTATAGAAVRTSTGKTKFLVHKIFLSLLHVAYYRTFHKFVSQLVTVHACLAIIWWLSDGLCTLSLKDMVLHPFNLWGFFLIQMSSTLINSSCPHSLKFFEAPIRLFWMPKSFSSVVCTRSLVSPSLTSVFRLCTATLSLSENSCIIYRGLRIP